MAPTAPVHYLLPLYPAFQLLDVAGPLDILNLLSLTQPASANITLTIIASTMDPVPTKPIPPIDPTTKQPKWTFPSFPVQASTKANTTFNESFVPHTTFTSYLSACESGTISDDPDSPNKPIDVLLIPGGVGSRIPRHDTASNTTQSNVADLMDFITKITPRVRHSIITVCTGSDILAQTGLLNSRRATTNMTRFDEVVARSPAVNWQKARRYVRSLTSEADAYASTLTQDADQGVQKGDGRARVFPGEIWTSAGISAGIDVMFAFVAEYHGGIEVARAAARTLEYEWREIPEGAVDPLYGISQEDADAKA